MVYSVDVYDRRHDCSFVVPTLTGHRRGVDSHNQRTPHLLSTEAHGKKWHPVYYVQIPDNGTNGREIKKEVSAPE